MMTADAWGAGTSGPTGHVLVRFADDEILDGAVDRLDLDRPDFELTVSDPGTNNRRALIPLPSVKCLTLGRRPLDPPMTIDNMQKVALRFLDGEVIKGLIADNPQRNKYGVTVELVSPAGDEIELLGIPYHSLKAVFYLKSWDSRPPEYVDVTGQWSGTRMDTPLVDLLGEIGRLADLRDRGELTDEDFQRRRRVILDKI